MKTPGLHRYVHPHGAQSASGVPACGVMVLLSAWSPLEVTHHLLALGVLHWA